MERQPDEEIEKINRKKLEEIVKRSTNSSPIILNDSSFFSEVSKHRLMLVDFWAPWCGPCRFVGPIIEQLAKEYSGRVSFGKLNVDDNPMASNSFGVRSIPTMIIFQNGKPVDSLIGAMPKAQIESRFRPYLQGSGPV